MKLFQRFEAVFFGLILVLSVCLRFPFLGEIPSGFHADEAAYGYNAYSVLKTGRDEYGRFLPLIFESFGDSKAAVYSYLTIPCIAVFGLTEFAVRLPSAIFGVVFVYMTYLLVCRLSKNKRLALLAMLLAAISPLGVELSRVQSDPLICIVFFYIALYLWLLWLEKRRGVYIAGFVLAIILSFLTYTVTRLFALPFFIILALFYWKTYDRQAKQVFMAVSSVVCCAVIVLSVGFAGGRFSQINVFSGRDVQLVLDEAIREDGVSQVPASMVRFIHNKGTAYARYMVTNASDYLSSDFLFFQSKQPRREQIPNIGVLFIVELPFLIIGIYQAVRRKLKYGLFGIAWLLLVPVTLSIISGETPNIHRFFLAMLPIYILVSLGVLTVWTKFLKGKMKILRIGIVFAFVLNAGYFLHQLFIHQPTHFPFYRGYAYKPLVGSLKKQYASYDQIVITKGNESPYIYILFFGAYDPFSYQRSGSHRDLDYQGFDKYIFVPYDCPSFNGVNQMDVSKNKERTLLVRRGNCELGKNDQLIDHVFWRDGSEAFQLVRYQDAQVELLPKN